VNPLKKILKYPGIQDFRQAVKELDEKQYIQTALVAGDLRNSYMVLYDLITKNFDKLYNPRNNDNMSVMY